MTSRQSLFVLIIELVVVLSVTTHTRAGSINLPNGTDSWICLPSSGGESRSVTIEVLLDFVLYSLIS